MNILIQMEIKAREFEARSLLALAAAERGDTVLVGDVRRHFIARPQDFAPSIFHNKSLTPSPGKRSFFALLGAHGSLLTSQDEEHWLNLPDFDVPARRRSSAETLGLAERSFAWGDHERDALHAIYPDQRSHVITTGVATGRPLATRVARPPPRGPAPRCRRGSTRVDPSCSSPPTSASSSM